MKLWEKGYAVLPEVMDFTVGDDPILDQKLAGYDIAGSIAHAASLRRTGVISGRDFERMRKSLRKMYALWIKGKFRIDKRDEDMHTKIEALLLRDIGETGKRIHTGRSRNDQVATALRLYMKDRLIAVMESGYELARTLADLARRHEFVIFPGYTHMRQAMPSSIGLWAGCHAESLLDSLKIVEAVLRAIDSCPLGSASGYGVPTALDRKLSARLLGFASVQNNVLAVQNSRGKFEGIVLSALADIMLDINRLSSDIMLFSMAEFGFLTLPQDICTGSSLMPQKRNPDVVELARASYPVVLACEFAVRQIPQGLISGYSRDLQLTKGYLIKGVETTLQSMAMMKLVCERLGVDKRRCAEGCMPELFATDAALALVRKGVPFRDAYRRVAGESDWKDIVDPSEVIRSRKNEGSSGKLGLSDLVKRIGEGARKSSGERRKFRTVLRRLIG